MKIFKRSIAGISLILACTMMILAIPQVAAMAEDAESELTIATFSKTDIIGSIITFSPEDFSSRVTGDDSLKSIILSSLPDGGILRLAGRTVIRGETIDVANLGTLSFVPDGTGELATSFSFLPVFSNAGLAADSVTVALELGTKKNDAPIAQDLEFETYVDVKLNGELKYTDPDGDMCSFTVTKQPKKGQVEITEAGFIYTPNEGKSGKDSFLYTAVDAKGNISKEATVSIAINKRGKETFTYTDLETSSSHYAALRLREEGIFTGETIGGNNFLYPNKTVSRAEFVALVAAITEMPMPTVAVGTGLADNSDIPVWAQPYVAAAVNVGVVQGESSPDGNRVFRAADGITRAEAASIINRALALATDGRSLSFADSRGIPEWSVQSVINTTAAGVVPAFSDGTFRPNDYVTREDAVNILHNMLVYRENNKTGIW